jgi:aspartate aminotransferase-like enzyme
VFDVAKKLFIPGPVDVSEDVAANMSEPMIGHRSKDYSELHKSCVEGLKKILYTENNVFIGPMSASGWMEAAVVNLVNRRALHIVNGAFSGRWYKISKACGKDAEKIDVAWGAAGVPSDVREKLESREYDCLFVTHNETSTAAMTPLEEFGKLCKDNNVLLCVDAVSSAAGVKIETDKLGIDVLVCGTQKCFGVAPGLAMTAVSSNALEKSRETPNKGLYFDYHDYLKKAQKDQTPSTPPIPQIRALDYQCKKILEVEGLENRFKRHSEMAKTTQEWAEKNWKLYCEDWCRSHTVTCVDNSREYDLADLGKKLNERGYQFSNGYGDLKGKAFRIAHMADRTPQELKEYLDVIDEIVG